MQRLTPQQKQARRTERQLAGLQFSAARMVVQNDYKRGCKVSELGFYASDPELRAIVVRLLAEGKAHIHIPRLAANEYIKD